MALIEILLFVISAIFATLVYFKWSFKYWERKGLAYVQPSIPFGTMENPFSRTVTIGLYIKGIYHNLKSQGHKHAGLYFFTRPEYMVIDPELIKHVLQIDFQYFVDKDHYYNEKVDPLSANLFAIGGSKWKALRAKLTPTFTTAKIKMMFETVLHCGLQMQKAVDDLYKAKKPIDIKDVVSRYSIDIIGSCAFGLNCNSFTNPDSEFRRYGEEIFKPLSKFRSVLIALAFFKPAFGHLINVAYFPKRPTEFFMKTVHDTVRFRETHNVVRNDILQVMIGLKNSTNCRETGLTMQEIAAHSFIFYIAGFETSSTTMTFAIYELSLNLDIQERVRDEVNRVFEKYQNKITYDTIMELKYTGQVVDETLRKYPPLPFLTRQCVVDYKVPNSHLVIEKGTKVIIPVYGLHYDSDYYPDPEKFDPERFTEENKANSNPFVYLPFGEGPRICLGLRFGLIETKLGLALLLKSYRFTLNGRTAPPLVMDKFGVLLSSEKAIFVDVEKM